MKKLIFDKLNINNYPDAKLVNRIDIPNTFVDTLDTIMDYTNYGITHNLKGHTFLVYLDKTPIALLLIGEAIPWDTDPIEMSKEPFYRLMGFVIDKDYRGNGFGKKILEGAIHQIYNDFGYRPVALACHKNNLAAIKFYLNNGFKATNVYENEDEYFIRY